MSEKLESKTPVAAATACSAWTDRQNEIIRHALGIRDGKQGYRNHYCTGEGSDDFADCEALVAIGVMERHTREWTPDFIYTVTPAAQSLFLLPNANVDLPDTAAQDSASKSNSPAVSG